MNKRLLWIAFGCVAVVAAAHIFGSIFYFYWNNMWYDAFVHFMGALAVAFFFIWVWFESGIFERSRPSKRDAMFAAVLFAGVIGLGWEYFEFVYGISNPIGGNYPLDTFHDLLFDFLGGIAAGFIARSPKLYE